MDPDQLKREIQTAHESIATRIVELRKQRDEFAEEIRLLLIKQKALPVMRTTRVRKTKDIEIAVE